MKNYTIGVVVFALGLLTSCNTWIDSGINVDPTSPKDATVDVILPTAQVGYAYALGGDLGRFSSLFTQHNQGIGDRQHGIIYRYTFTESDIDNAWKFNLYGGPMYDLFVLLDKARSLNSPHYLGVAQVMMAHAIGTVTDLWGDVPYSSAFAGGANLQPTYDNQQSIYASIQSMLSEAVTNLSSTTSELSPGADDLIFAGDLNQWIKVAWGLKARNAMHLYKRDAGSAQQALTYLQNAMTSNTDDMQFTFGTIESEGNPWYQFVVQRQGDLSFGVKLSEIMNNTNDPRRPFYATVDTLGMVSGSSEMGPFYASINSAVPFITYTECKFIEAEAQFRTGNPAQAHTAYVDAIRASLERTGVSQADADAFLAQTSVDPGVANMTLNDIMTQKYVAMYTQSESFTDWRRTELPSLTPTVQGQQVPRRFPYPQSERLYNGANMPNLTINDRVWWDVP